MTPPIAERIPPQGKSAARRGRVKHANRNGHQRVAAEPEFVRRAVQRDEHRVDRPGRRVEANERPRDSGRSLYRVLHAKPAKALAAVAPVDRLARAAGCAGRRNARPNAPAQDDLGLNRGPPARVPDAARDERMDAGWLIACAPRPRLSPPGDGRGRRAGPAHRRTSARSVSGQVFHRRLAVHARQEQGRQQRGRPRSNHRRSPSRRREIGARQRRNGP